MRTVPPRSTIALLVAVVAALLAAIAPAAASASASASASEGDIIVKYATGADAQDRADARADAGVVRGQALPLPATEVVTPEQGTTVRDAVADLNASPDVAYAEADAPRHAFATPDDPSFGMQWSLQNTGQDIFSSATALFYAGTAGDDIDVAPAWDLGTEAIPTVAVVDSGVDLTHPDLAANIVPGGHDFVDGDNAPNDQNGHGTHVAGTIGAVGDNNLGVTGVAWKAHILPIRVLDATGSGSVSRVLSGEQYAVASGVKIVNLSLGGDTPSQLEYTTLRDATDTLFVVAAGNDAADVDVADSYPCAYQLPNVVCVAATDGRDQLASFSNYGARSVAIAAPGEDILSTYPRAKVHSGYAYLSGTSMATPEVAGAAALVLGHDSTLTPWQIREKLVDGSDKVPALAGKVASGGRLDVFGAISAVPPVAGEAPVSAADAPAARRPTTPAPSTPAPVPATPTPVAATPAHTTTPAADRTAPTIATALAGRGALRALLAGKLRVSTSASERASLRLELRVDARTAKKLHLSGGPSAVVIATGSATLTKAGTKTVTLRLSSKAKRALAHVRSLKATLRATATDAAGNRRTRSSALTITR